jgi:hypothetical protein
MYDQQIGRWHIIDPMSENSPELTPFRYAYNNPISYIDILGMSEGWYSDEDNNVVYDKNVNSQQDLKNRGTAGTYLGQEGYAVNESSGKINHYNDDGTITQGVITLPVFTFDLGLKNGFPAQMYTMADRDFMKGSYTTFQNTIRSQQAAFTFITDYFAPVVTTVSTMGLEGMAASGPTQGMVQGLIKPKVSALADVSFSEIQAMNKAASTEMNAFFKSKGTVVPPKSVLEAYKELTERILTLSGGAPAGKLTTTSMSVQYERLKMINEALKAME